MRVSWKDKAFHWFTIFAMWVPPWNIFWWIVGFLFYTLSGARKHDHSGDGALAYVVGAPVTLPLMPFMMFKEWREGRRLDQQELVYREVVDWIIAAFQKRGLVVKREFANGAGMFVEVVEVPTDKIETYQRIYAYAIHRFSLVAPKQIVSNAELQYLDRAWAEKYGMAEYAEIVFYPPCVDCKIVESCVFRFGKEAIESMRIYLEEQHHEMTFVDKHKRTVDGHLCQACIKKEGELWCSSSSRRNSSDDNS